MNMVRKRPNYVVDKENAPIVSGTEPIPEIRSGTHLHAELFYSARTGDPIPVGCKCEIGATHTYRDWLVRFQLPATIEPGVIRGNPWERMDEDVVPR
jgi:hypothetical protein